MKSLMSLWSCTAEELAVRCCTSATRDIKYVAGRTKHEGLWFLAVTLADFGKSFERWLDQGFVVPSDVPGFRKKSGHLTGLPAFLQGFLGRVFDPCSGVLLEDPDIEAVYAVRQLTLMFSKIAFSGVASDGNALQEGRRKVAHPEREKLAIDGFVQCEQDVRRSDALLDPSYMEDFKRMSEMLFGDLFAKVDRDVYFGRIIPKHGPGATADRLKGNRKYDQRTWTRRLQQVFPAEEFLASSCHNYDMIRREVNILEPGAEIPVRVITVPKTIKTPRVIAIEPTCMQYMQQGVYRALLDAFSEDSFLSRVIGFKDQEPNRGLARRGSLRGDLATLDLSEASDRVSYEHVRAMLLNYPHLLGAVDATRSRKAHVPGHGEIRLAKFASMGSALCFPFEAMVFLTLIFLGIERESSAPLSRETLIKRYRRRVRVFGDDLVVPKENVLSIVDELQTFGHVVNVSKSYWIGRFRESCGREYYDGHDVSIVKVRNVLPSTKQDADGVISAVALRNLLYWAGLWKSAAWMDRYLGKLIKVFPNVAPSSPLLGRESVLGYQTDGVHPYLHSPLTRGYLVETKPPPSPLDGVGALHKCLLRTAQARFGLTPLPVPRRLAIDLPNVDEEHLERTGRPERVGIKLGRQSPY